MSDPIRITVYGDPRPQGSKKTDAIYRKNPVTGFREPVMVNGRVLTRSREDAEGLTSWRTSVAQRVAEQYGGPVLDGPVRLRLTFMVPRGQNHYGTGRNAEVLKDSAPLFVEKAPDVLKLARAVEDALKGVLITDDKFIHGGEYSKVWVDRTERPGVVIEAFPEPVRTVGQEREAERAAREPSLLAA